MIYRFIKIRIIVFNPLPDLDNANLFPFSSRKTQAIAEAAAKQSKRAYIPEIGDVVTYAEALREAGTLDHVLVPYECAEDITKTREIISGIRSGESVAVFIGPEGGIDEREIETAAEAGAKMITLGRRILRTETAAISTLAILMFMFEAS